MPVAEFTEKAEMLLSSLFTTYKKLPLGSSATPKGCWPVGTGLAMVVTEPLLKLNADNVFAPTFAL